jgi:hypothetical protein
MKLSAIIKSSICVLGLVGASNFLAARANADQAAARASVSITNPSSFTQSVSGEVLLPSGLYFSGTGTPATDTDPAEPGMTLIVTPGVDVSTNTETNPGTTTAKITSLSFNAGTVAAISEVDGAGTLSDVVAAMLQGTNDDGVNAASIDDAAAIIKAAAGVDGLE